MVRRELLTAAVGAAVASCAIGGDRAKDHVLRGFVVVDPDRRTAEVRDVHVVDGRVQLSPPAEAARLPVIDGRGRWLVPGLYDTRIASWGNASPMHYTKLYQGMGVDTLLKAHLYAGVTQVVVGAGMGERFEDGRRRVELLKITGAQLRRACRALSGPTDDPPGVSVKSVRDVAPALQAELGKGGSYVQIHYAETLRHVVPPVSTEILREAVALSRAAGQTSWVMVGQWSEAKDAITSGATVVQGLPADEAPPDLLAHMAETGTYFAPTLSVLDLGEMLGNDPVSNDPLCARLVRQDVLQSYRDLALYEGPVKELYETARPMKDIARRTLERCGEAHVKLLVATDSGWSPGAFQGVAVHRNLHWMAWAGVDPWTRLRAATLWPAELLRCAKAFEDGAPANFVVMAEDPIVPHHVRSSVDEVCLRGRWLDREALRPDLTRGRYYG
jgi:hypothetical protein